MRLIRDGNEEKELGAEKFNEDLGAAWRRFSTDCKNWLVIEEHSGLIAGQGVYHQFLHGRAQPNTGYIVNLV